MPFICNTEKLIKESRRAQTSKYGSHIEMVTTDPY